jgi:invasion protein IalB
LRNLDNNTKLDININQKNNGKNNTIPVNSKNFDEIYKRLNQKKEKNNLKILQKQKRT